MYDATIGRFFSADPIGLESGDSNFYRYSQNNPANAVDPSGLESWVEGGNGYKDPDRYNIPKTGNLPLVRCYQKPKSNSSGSCNSPTAIGSPSTSGGELLWAEFSALLGQFDPKASGRYNKEWFLGLSREEQLAYIKYLKDWNDFSKKEAARAEERAARDRLPKIGKADRDNPYCSFNERWAGKKINSEADAFAYRRDWLWANGQSDIAQMELAELVLLSLGPSRAPGRCRNVRDSPIRGNKHHPLTCPNPVQKQKPKICDPIPEPPKPPKVSGKQPHRFYSARELIRRAEEPGPFHNFPESFNQDIFNGTRHVISANYILYTRRGCLNGRSGTYEIGVRPSATGNTEVIVHRFFRPD